MNETPPSPGPAWPPAALWSATSPPTPASWRYALSAGERHDLATALRHDDVRLAPPRDIAVNRFRTPRLMGLVGRVATALGDGPGLFLLSGLPVAGWSSLEIQKVLWGLGAQVGTPVPQTTAGELLRSVEDRGRDLHSGVVRGHDTNAALPFHSDRCDVVALLCVRPAESGGVSRVASAPFVHEELRRRRPDLLQQLYAPLPHDRRGEQRHGEHPWTPLPIFSNANGWLVTRYVRRFIESADRFGDAPALTFLQRAAIDAVDDILREPSTAIEMELAAGDVQFLNSHVTLHARSAFRDSDNDCRLLWRLWLAPPWSMRLPMMFEPLFGCVEPGAIRGGVGEPD